MSKSEQNLRQYITHIKLTDHILEMPRLGCIESFITNSRILLLELGLRINFPNYFNDQRRHSIHLATVIVRETPELGTLEWITFNPNYLIRISTVETFNFSP